MATLDVFGDLFGPVTDTLTFAADKIGQQADNLWKGPDQRYASDVFPQDLGAENMNHYMIISLYTPGSVASGPGGFTQNNYNVALFMPSEEGGGLFPVYTDTHEYAEISMSNIFMNQIAGAETTQRARGAAAATARTINPGVQVLYKSTHLRTFDFSFMFAPRSQKESEALERIIKGIRSYAAPLDEGLFYRSPAEVQISFHWKGKENPHMIKMKRQTIRQIDVNFAPSGVYSTFSNGYPVYCQMTMRTREMEIVTRDDIQPTNSPLTSGGMNY